MTEQREDLRPGDFCWCSKGRPGVITGRKELEWGWSWVGIGLDDASPWASRNPRTMTLKEVTELSDSKLIATGNTTNE